MVRFHITRTETLIIFISQKPNPIIVLIDIERKKCQKATQGART